MPLQIPHPNTALHLYRHLLRESTYLPALCRPWIASRIQERFRACRPKNPASYIKQGHASLRYLRSANAGHIGRLEHLCLLATGRIGKRRRILATAQLSNGLPADTAELERSRVEAVLETSHSDRALNTPNATDATDATDAVVSPSHKHDWLDNWSLDMIATLAQSQAKHQGNKWPKAMRRGLDTKKVTSGTNCFGRPYGPRLVRNKLKRHWAAVLSSLLPPLPQGEWDHLASLVKGDANVAELKVPPRRPVAQPLQHSDPDLADSQWDWSQHVLQPARVIERGSARRWKSLTGEEDQDPRGHGRPIGLRVMGPRRLQRVYGRIWAMSPVMKKQPGKEKWSVSWGQAEQRISAPSTSDLVFFRGVTNDGKVLSKAGASSQG